MGEFKELAKKLLLEEEVDLYEKRYNDGTEEFPDIMINRIFAVIEKSKMSDKDIVVYLSKEDDESTSTDQTFELYRIPYIEDLDILEKILSEANNQSHCRG